MAMTEAIAATTSADTATITCSGRTVIAITGGVLKQGETVTIKGEDPAGTFNDELYRFIASGPNSVLIETYRDVQVAKTATATALAVDYGA